MNFLTYVYRLIPSLLVLSLVTNLTILVSPLFMMQVLDRVIPSGNQNTLMLLGLLAIAALILQAMIEVARDLCLKRLSNWVEQTATAQALDPACDDPQMLINQIGSVSGFLAGPLAPIVLNTPWIPVLVFVLFLLHPLFVVLLLSLVGVYIGSKACTHLLERPSETQASWHAKKEQQCLNIAAQAAQSGEIATISSNLRQRFAAHQAAKLKVLEGTYKVAAVNGAVSGFLRQAAQILTLALGAYLVTEQLLSAGGMIAASILLAKTYGTAESAIAQFPKIRASLADHRALSRIPESEQMQNTDIHDLSGALRVENLVFPRGGGAPPRLDRITFDLKPGECLAVIGASGSGKTTLLKAVAGVAPSPIGSVFYDQSEIRGLSETTLFDVTGYLPQQAALLPGTIAENISCFTPNATSAAIVSAAKTAGVHGLISALPDSYDTDLDRDSHILSSGQKQRIALARAIFNNANYLFLDEPNALLDAEGERALCQALNKLKENGTTIIMTLHRSGLMMLADKVMRLENGRCVDFGDRSDVLGRMTTGQRQISLPRLYSSTQDLTDWINSQFTRADDVAFSHKAQLIGTEMFAAACEASGEDRASKITMSFSFKNDHHCELALIETGQSSTAATLQRVQDIVALSCEPTQALSLEEQALVNVLRLGDKAEISSHQNQSVFRVALSNMLEQPAEPVLKAG